MSDIEVVCRWEVRLQSAKVRMAWLQTSQKDNCLPEKDCIFLLLVKDAENAAKVYKNIIRQLGGRPANGNAKVRL